VGTSLAELPPRRAFQPYLRARLPLAFLVPAPQAATLDGCHGPDVSVACLVREGRHHALTSRWIRAIQSWLRLGLEREKLAVTDRLAVLNRARVR
jgi:hypothetical protein